MLKQNMLLNIFLRIYGSKKRFVKNEFKILKMALNYNWLGLECYYFKIF